MTNIIIGDERKVTPLELALKLAGAEYGLRDKKEEIEIAKKNGLVIVYGASDDLIEFRGAIDDEDDVYGGGIVAIENACIHGHGAVGEDMERSLLCDNDG